MLNIGGGDATPVRLFGELYCPARPAVNISWDCKVIEGRNQPWVALVVTIKKHFTQESIPAPRCSCNKVTKRRAATRRPTTALKLIKQQKRLVTANQTFHHLSRYKRQGSNRIQELIFPPGKSALRYCAPLVKTISTFFAESSLDVLVAVAATVTNSVSPLFNSPSDWPADTHING